MRALFGALALLAPVPAFAHEGHSRALGLFSGFAHPFGGLDHLVAMIAVGLWAASFGTRRMALLLPGGFLAGMAVGGVVGVFGPAMAVVEYGVIGTAVLLAMAVAVSLRAPVMAAVALVALAGALHGVAHGAEMEAGANVALYAAGFLVATAVLHAAGFGIARMAMGFGRVAVLRGAGFGAAGLVVIVALV